MTRHSAFDLIVACLMILSWSACTPSCDSLPVNVVMIVIDDLGGNP